MTATRQNVRAQDIEVGCVLFLPRESFAGNLAYMWSDVNGHPCQTRGYCVLKREGHTHPVVIIGKHYGLNETSPDILELSFIQMTHSTPQSTGIFGPSIFTPCGHHRTKRLFSTENYSSRYWFRGIGYLDGGPSNFRIPHAFFASLRSLKTMTKGPRARAYSSRLDEESYLRLMQRLNLEPKLYVPDDYWNDDGPTPPSGDSAEHEQPSSQANTTRFAGIESVGSFNQPHGHRVANPGCM